MRLRIILCLTVLLAMMFMLNCAAQAEGSISLSAKLDLEGTLPAYEEVFKVELVAQEQDAPMPQGSYGQVYQATRTGAGTISLGTISFARPGRWNYIVRQVPLDATCSYDLREYALQVSAYNGGSGGLDVMVVLHQGETDTKLEDIRFKNTYASSEAGSITPTGVQDYWMVYATGAVVLLVIALWLIGLLRKERDDE